MKFILFFSATNFQIFVSTFLNNLKQRFNNSSGLDIKSQFIWLMSSEDIFILQKLRELLENLSSYRKVSLNDI